MGFLKKLEKNFRHTIRHPDPASILGVVAAPFTGGLSLALPVAQILTTKEANKSSTQIIVKRNDNITISPPQNTSGVTNCSVHQLGQTCQLTASKIDPNSGHQITYSINAALCTVCGCYVDTNSGVTISYQ